jgi:hypothetical protein
MRVSEYLKQYPVVEPASVYKDIPELLSKALGLGRYPPPAPLALPRNVITGAPARSPAAFRLELEALVRGYDRALWISAADAAFLSLRPKEKERPVPAVFPFQNRLSFQHLYLIDSFTPDSLADCFSFANPAFNEKRQPAKPLPGPALALRNTMAERIVYGAASHDTEGRADLAANYRNYSSPSSPSYFLAGGLYKTFLSNIPRPAWKAFDYLRKYRIRQLTGLDLPGTGRTDDPVKTSFDRLSKSDGGEILPVVYFASSFASRLCRGELSPPSAGLPRRAEDRSGAAKETPIDELLRS